MHRYGSLININPSAFSQMDVKKAFTSFKQGKGGYGRVAIDCYHVKPCYLTQFWIQAYEQQTLLK